MSEVLVVFTTALLSPTTALLPLQLLWINLITDGLPALALGVDPREHGVMSRPPRDPSESILSARRQGEIVWQGLVMTAAALSLYYFVAPDIPGTTPLQARTMLFTGLVLTQLLHAFDFRSTTGTVWHHRSFANGWLIASLVGSMSLQAAIIYVPSLSRLFQTAPLTGIQWIAIVGAALVAVVVMDASKLVIARRHMGNRR
jgi:Ca2+-transporting ATPase